MKYLKDTKVNINNILIMTGDFNIRDSSWNPNFLHHCINSNLLTDIIDIINLCMSRSTNQVPTRYSDNWNDSNLVIKLMFLRLDLSELDNHMIYLEWRLSSDHAPFTIKITIIEEYIQTKKCILVKNSEEEENFITKLIKAFTRLNTENIHSIETLK